jgi:hypothetical protein
VRKHKDVSAIIINSTELFYHLAASDGSTDEVSIWLAGKEHQSRLFAFPIGLKFFKKIDLIAHCRRSQEVEIIGLVRTHVRRHPGCLHRVYNLQGHNFSWQRRNNFPVSFIVSLFSGWQTADAGRSIFTYSYEEMRFYPSI